MSYGAYLTLVRGILEVQESVLYKQDSQVNGSSRALQFIGILECTFGVLRLLDRSIPQYVNGFLLGTRVCTIIRLNELYHLEYGEGRKMIKNTVLWQFVLIGATVLESSLSLMGQPRAGQLLSNSLATCNLAFRLLVK